MFLIRYNGQYVLQMQVDVRTWSVEMSPAAAESLMNDAGNKDSNQAYSNCLYPAVMQVDVVDVPDIEKQILEMYDATDIETTDFKTTTPAPRPH
jgi:hypothetical protein